MSRRPLGFLIEVNRRLSFSGPITGNTMQGLILPLAISADIPTFAATRFRHLRIKREVRCNSGAIPVAVKTVPVNDRFYLS